jgi:hypothetical protein
MRMATYAYAGNNILSDSTSGNNRLLPFPNVNAGRVNPPLSLPPVPLPTPLSAIAVASENTPREWSDIINERDMYAALALQQQALAQSADTALRLKAQELSSAQDEVKRLTSEVNRAMEFQALNKEFFGTLLTDKERSVREWSERLERANQAAREEAANAAASVGRLERELQNERQRIGMSESTTQRLAQPKTPPPAPLKLVEPTHPPAPLAPLAPPPVSPCAWPMFHANGKKCRGSVQAVKRDVDEVVLHLCEAHTCNARRPGCRLMTRAPTGMKCNRCKERTPRRTPRPRKRKERSWEGEEDAEAESEKKSA